MKLIDVTPENYDLAKKLSVGEEQKRFIANITCTLADAFVYQDAIFKLASFNGEIVGYLLLYPFVENDIRIINFVRIAIHHEYQGRGYGKALLGSAADLALELFPDAKRFKICVFPENRHAIYIYKKFGFVQEGEEGKELSFFMNIP